MLINVHIGGILLLKYGNVFVYFYIYFNFFNKIQWMKQKYYNLIMGSSRHTCIFSYLLTLCCFSSMVSWSSGGLTSRRQVKVRFFWEGSIGGQPTELTGSNMWLNLSQHRNITILQVLSYRKHYLVFKLPITEVNSVPNDLSR